MDCNQYDKTIDSRLKWIGEIPSHWKLSKFKHNFTFSKSTNTSKNPTILSLTLQGIKIRDISTNEGQIASSYDNYTKVYKKDIVLNPMDLISGFVDCSPVEGVISPAYYTLKPNPDIDPEYYKYYLQKHYYERIFFPFAEGVSVDHRWTLKKEDFLNFGLIKPPLEEQQKIANYLDKKTVKIDETIIKNQQLIELFEEKRIALINHVVTKGLNPDVPMKDSRIEWLGEIPENWNMRKFGHLIKLITKGATPTSYGFDFLDEGINFIKIESIAKNGEFIPSKFNYISQECNNFLSRSKMKEGDLLFSIAGALGRVAIVNSSILPANTNQALSIIRINNDFLLTEYAFHTLKADYILHQIDDNMVQSAQANLSMESIREFKILIPPINEQKKLVKYLNNETRKLMKLIAKVKQNIDLLEEYKISLIHHVVTGKIDVRGEII